MKTPDWFQDAIIYQVLIDRFAGFGQNTDKDWSKPEFYGGNIQGIIDRLNYLEKLGVNTLWLSPFYKGSRYHGYHVTDFFKVDPRFGSKQDLEELIDEVHNREMKIIADFVPNHCSREHPFFQKAREDKNSEYYDWFYFQDWPDDYLAFLSFDELVKLNLEHKPARDHILKAAKFWLKKGLDGYRLDHVVGPPNKFWETFREEIKADFPDKVLIGEAGLYTINFDELKTLKVKNKYLKWILGGSSDRLFKEYIGELDGVLDFQFFDLVKKYIAKGNSSLSKKLLDWRLNLHYRKYKDNPEFYLLTFLDNHDMNRFLFECNGDKEKLKEAAEIQFSLEQPPIIYYGTEVGISQEKSISEVSDYGDLQARRPMKWNKKEQDRELFNFYQDLIEDRKKAKNPE